LGRFFQAQELAQEVIVKSADLRMIPAGDFEISLNGEEIG
jgi:hypothetical protein